MRHFGADEWRTLADILSAVALLISVTVALVCSRDAARVRAQLYAAQEENRRLRAKVPLDRRETVRWRTGPGSQSEQ